MNTKDIREKVNIEDLELDYLSLDDYEECFTEEAKGIIGTLSTEDWIFLSNHASQGLKESVIAVKMAYILGFRAGRKEV